MIEQSASYCGCDAGFLRHDECRHRPRSEADGARCTTSDVCEVTAHLLRNRRRDSADEHADSDDEHVLRDRQSDAL